MIPYTSNQTRESSIYSYGDNYSNDYISATESAYTDGTAYTATFKSTGGGSSIHNFSCEIIEVHPPKKKIVSELDKKLKKQLYKEIQKLHSRR